MPSINARTTDAQRDASYDSNPDSCPICHHAIEPLQLSFATITGPIRSHRFPLEIVFQCPRYKCRRLFIGRYSHRGRDLGSFYFDHTTPSKFVAPSISDEVAKVSPDFRHIYSQACAADSHELDQIVGIALRKSLEFLIKDYCVHKSPDEETAIKKEFLGKTIKDRLPEGSLKKCATRANWLGTDETHYERRWEDKDINDLKILIELTMDWIHTEILSERYEQEMPERK